MALEEADKEWFKETVKATNAELILTHVRTEHLDLDRRIGSMQKQLWMGAGVFATIAAVARKLGL